jgi:hypothetical protein
MLYGAKFLVRYALGLDPAGRNLAVFPDDTFIVSYPRSGNTWTRFLLANLLHPAEPATFLNIESTVPDAEAQSNQYLKKIARPRYIKTHEYFDHRYARVIYIVRDPRDVVISYFHFQRKYGHISDNCALDDYVGSFVAGRVSGDWGSWGEHVGSWTGARMDSPRFLLVRYEDLESQPAAELKNICDFLGIKPEAALLSQTIERSSAQKMKELEKKQGEHWVSTKGKRADIPFIGSASSGKWRTTLPPASVAAIETAWGDLMLRLGYQLSSDRERTIAASREEVGANLTRGRS